MTERELQSKLDEDDLLSDLSELSELDEDQFAELEDDQVEAQVVVRDGEYEGDGVVDEDEDEYNVYSIKPSKKRDTSDEENVHKDSRRQKVVKKRVKARTEEETAPLDPAAAAKFELKRMIDEAVYKPKKKKKMANEDDLEQMADEQIAQLREEMREAAIVDAQANADKKPATHKLRMLPRVEAVLEKSALSDSILENNLLETLRLWLEPLPDRSLPSFTIQKSLFSALQKLPIRTDHLRESGIGKVVNFYTKSNKAQEVIKRQANLLVRDWSRLITKKTDNYRDSTRREAAFDPASLVLGRSRQTVTDTREPNGNKTQIPRAVPVTYEIAPRSNVYSHNSGKLKSDSYKKLKSKMRQKATSASAKSSLSVQ